MQYTYLLLAAGESRGGGEERRAPWLGIVPVPSGVPARATDVTRGIMRRAYLVPLGGMLRRPKNLFFFVAGTYKSSFPLLTSRSIVNPKDSLASLLTRRSRTLGYGEDFPSIMAGNHEISMKTKVGHHEFSGEKLREETARIDAFATAPGTTLESFADLDEKKILRKVEALI